LRDLQKVSCRDKSKFRFCETVKVLRGQARQHFTLSLDFAFLPCCRSQVQLR